MEYLLFTWVVCGVASYASCLAFFQRKSNAYGIAREARTGDITFAVFVGLLGPVGLVAQISLAENFKYGFMLAPLPDDKINYGGRE